MKNVFIKYPKKGDAVVGELATGKVKFIKLSTYDDGALDLAKYEKIGTVGHRNGRKVLIIYKENTSKTYCVRPWWYLSGYTLDGTDRRGTLTLRFASNSWGSGIDKVIDYNATSIDAFVEQLNAAFAADADMNGQDWYADIVEGRVRIHCVGSDYRQYSSNSAKNGFAITGSMPEIVAVANMRRRHGGAGGEGACSNVARMMSRYRADQAAGTYNPTNVLTSIKTAYPVCLPAYLGTSANVDGDKCKILRDFYGEGEEGWRRYIEAQRPVVPTDWGNMGMKDGLERTKILASFKYTSRKVTTPATMCAGADYCLGKDTQCIPQGKWYLPTTEDVYHILDGVGYGTNSSRDADPVNECLNKMKGSAINNGSGLWSCLRYHSYVAWSTGGGYGFFVSYGMYSSYVCVPVSLHELED